MSKLKAVVLCAGEGTRLRPLTFSKPKHLLPVAGKPLLGHVLESLAAADLDEVALVVGHRPEAVQRYVGDGEKWGLRVTYVTQEKPLGLADAVQRTEAFVAGNPFILYLGDNLLEQGIQGLVAEVRKQQQTMLLLKEVDDPQRFGVVVLDDEQRVTQLLEKPADPPSNLAIVAVYAFESSIFEAIRHIKPSARGELEITDAIQWLVDQGQAVGAQVVSGYWEDAGEPLTLLRTNRRYLDRQTRHLSGTIAADCQVEGAVRVGEGTRIVGSRLTGPCTIGRNCVIEWSVIGPYTALGDGCVVQNSLLEDSVIQDDCRIAQLSSGLKRSVLGEKVEITGDPSATSPLHLISGDLAQIRMLES
jgi:glucose-1-phosphate thymidylyltransferase